MENNRVNPEQIRSAGKTIFGIVFLSILYVAFILGLNWSYKNDPDFFTYTLGVSGFFGIVQTILILRFATFLVKCDE